MRIFLHQFSWNQCTLGPLHGGANQEVIEMLEAIKADGGDTEKSNWWPKGQNSGFRLMGFGHQVL
jgi:citrate synthase